jgi:hypothetical protein
MGGDETLLAACGQLLANPGEVFLDPLAGTPVGRSDFEGLFKIGDRGLKVAPGYAYVSPIGVGLGVSGVEFDRSRVILDPARRSPLSFRIRPRLK